MQQVPLADGLFTWPPEPGRQPVLVGGKASNGAIFFPHRRQVNTDGGLLANGEPVGASGLRQVYELMNQLRGRAGERQVKDARVGYAQLYGAPGTAAVTILSR